LSSARNCISYWLAIELKIGIGLKSRKNLKFIEPLPGVSSEQWNSWTWQLKSAFKTKEQFENYFILTEEESRAFETPNFKIQVTPYYASLSSAILPQDPIRKIIVPRIQESQFLNQQMLDPLGENKNRPHPRIIHRYPDRLLLLITDYCSVYCRYCTRKHFTAKDQVLIKKEQLNSAIEYIKTHKEVREVIFSGGDPLTVSDDFLLSVVEEIYKIDHVDLIRLGTRMPVVVPMRIQKALLENLKAFQPIYFMVHFNHPKEITQQSAEALTLLVDNGFPVFNQMVLLNGVNNHPVVIEELSRRLLRLRVKPYYMFQCDPSIGTDHLRTSIEDSLKIQKQIWGKISGLAMPNLSLDIPGGGGKVGWVPNYITGIKDNIFSFKGWDGIEGEYVNPPEEMIEEPCDWKDYL
jgi:lysine 2,3-aminomutase